MLTLQAIFNRSFDGVLRQGGRSSHYGSCAYRGQEDRRCGVGHIIEDQYYDPAFDSTECSTGVAMLLSRAQVMYPLGLRFRDALLASGVDAYDQRTVDFCDELQKIHDTAGDRPYRYRQRMRVLAYRYKLEMPEC
jgi:hypothetical protein